MEDPTAWEQFCFFPAVALLPSSAALAPRAERRSCAAVLGWRCGGSRLSRAGLPACPLPSAPTARVVDDQNNGIEPRFASWSFLL